MGGVQVDEWPAAVVSQRFGVGFQARCLGFEERARVLEQNVAAVQVALERSPGKQRVEMALENQAVESSDRAGYRVPVQITESGHVDLARVRWFTSSKVGAAISLKSIWRAPDRRRLWLWPQAALRHGGIFSGGWRQKLLQLPQHTVDQYNLHADPRSFHR